MSRMAHFLERWLSLTAAAAVMAWMLPGMHVVGDNTLLAVGAFALFMALINASIKPVIHLLALPLSILSLGLVALVINVLLMELASWLALSIFRTGIAIGGFWWAVLGGFIMMLVNGAVSAIIKN